MTYPRYCIFGDAVAIASNLQSTGKGAYATCNVWILWWGTLDVSVQSDVEIRNQKSETVYLTQNINIVQ